MKKLLALVLILALALSCTSAMAYVAHTTNEATFETMEEAKVNGPAWLAAYTGRDSYAVDAAMEKYPEGTTWLYRSSDMFTFQSAATRINTNFLVYTDAAFASKDEAYAYIENMGLIDIIEGVKGSILLVTPVNPEKGFGAADQYAFYLLQSAMTNIGGRNGMKTCMDQAYYGGLNYRYVIGIDGGATFINNYIASQLDYVGRIAGLLLVNGSMELIRNVAGLVPTYMVNPTDLAVEKYKAANDVDAWGYEDDQELFFNQARPLQKVVVSYADEIDLSTLVPYVWDYMFKHCLRNAVIRNGEYTGNTEFASYNFNDTPYSLGERVTSYKGVTDGGVYVFEHIDDKMLVTEENTRAINYWIELLPEEALAEDAAPKSIPLVLFNHGGGDDVLQYLEEIGAMEVAEHNRVAIIAPYHSSAGTLGADLTALVRYMLETYPALDPARTYVCGYSMGGRATVAAVVNDASLFAAACPQGAVYWTIAEEDKAQFDELNIPMLFLTSTYDYHVDADNYCIRWSNYNGMNFIWFDYKTNINEFLGFNEMPLIDEYDFEKYPYAGFKADTYTRTIVNGEYANHNWFIEKDGVPMIGLNITEFLPHGLYQEYAKIAWNFFKHYARNQETMEIEYTAVVD